MPTELDQLRKDFNDFRVEVERRFSDQAIEGQKMFQEALDAVPAGITEQREQEMREKQRAWKIRERIYTAIVALGTAWMAWGPDIERFFHH